ncbi:MAG: CDP-glucose 4,6-dehydratase [Burkholderiales bacterium]
MEDLDLSGLFGGAYAHRRVLVTGHSGFKGSWLAMWLRALGARVAGLSLAPAAGPAHHALLGGDDGPWTDLRDARAVDDAVRAFAPEIVFHLAAQPLVRASYREPLDTFATNVTGLIHLLESVRRCGAVRAVVNATTDKCYRNDTPAAAGPSGFTEADPLGGHDPYSASKACAEIVSACWRASFLGARDGAPPVALATARAGNVIGGGDWSEDRLVPDLVRAAIAGTPCRLRNPTSVRPWQHVLEPLAGYLQLGRMLLESPAGSQADVQTDVQTAFNFGPARDGHASVGEIVQGFAAHWPALRVEMDAGPHPHEAEVLRLDCTRAREALGWRPVWDTATTLARTARWYRHWHETGTADSAGDLRAYVADARAASLPWAATGVPHRVDGLRTAA